MARSGLDPPAFAMQWENSSGVAPRSAVALEHRLGIMQLGLAVCQDRLDVTQLASIEHLARRLLQIEKAVRRNPKAPDFEGLNRYLDHVTDPASGAAAPLFDQHIADEMKVDANILKQTRLARETFALQRTPGPSRPKKEAKPKAKAKNQE